MLYTNAYFNNYAEFTEMFRDANGCRKNPIVLDAIKFALKHRWGDVIGKRMSLHELYEAVLDWTRIDGGISNCPHYRCYIGSEEPFYSHTIETDDHKGVCVDGDVRQVRFVRHLTAEQIERTPDHQDHPKVVKKKAGKLMRELITEWYADMPEALLNYVCETFANKWCATRSASDTRYTLHVDNNLRGIYSSERNDVSGSCMTNCDLWEFYTESVSARAAYLTDGMNDNHIVARCVLFDEVEILGDDEHSYTYAERQYAKNGDTVLKQLLVDKLVAGGYIDFYKQVGASYSDNRKIVRAEDGRMMDDKVFRIYCHLGPHDPLSYQDTFVHYDRSRLVAFNDDVDGCYDSLNTTDGSLDGREWDEYHECYCDELTIVYVWRNGSYVEMYTDASDTSDFNYDWDDGNLYDEGVWHGRKFYCFENPHVVRTNNGVYYGDYIHEDDAAYCEMLDETHHVDDVVYSSYYEDNILLCDAAYSDDDEDWYIRSKEVFERYSSDTERYRAVPGCDDYEKVTA